MPATLDLSKVIEPKFTLNLPGGEEKSYDPWKLVEDIEKAGAAEGVTQFDAIRVGLGLPTQEESDVLDKADSAPAFHTPTRQQCMEVQERLMNFVQELAVTKKLTALGRKIRT